jgi:tetrahydromethanopterin S-methyltransferase subunit G
MEDKVFELMSKMYSDITARLDSIENKLDNNSKGQYIIKPEKFGFFTALNCKER